MLLERLIIQLNQLSQNDSDEIKSLISALRNAKNINARSATGRTALHYAAQNGHQAIVTQLLAVEGIDINVQDEGGQTALHWAVYKVDQAIVTQLLAVEGIDINVQDEWGRTALHYAAQNGHQAIVTQLLAVEGIDINLTDKWRQTALHWAVKKNHQAIVTQLLAVEGIDINVQDEWGRTALHYAVEAGHQAIVTQLLAVAGININVQDEWRRAALHELLKVLETDEDKATLKLLIEHGASLTIPNKAKQCGQDLLPPDLKEECEALAHQFLIQQQKNWYPFVGNSKQDIHETLLQLRENKNCRYYLMQSVEAVTIERDGKKIVLPMPEQSQPSILLYELDEKIANRLETQPLEIRSLTMSAFIMRQYEEDQGGAVNLAHVEQLYTQFSHLSRLLSLLRIATIDDIKTELRQASQQAYLNAPDLQRGWTALHWMAHRGRHEVIELLLKKEEVNKEQLDSQGRTPLHVAAQYHRLGVVEKLFAHGVAVDRRDYAGNTPLLLAARGWDELQEPNAQALASNTMQALVTAGALLTATNHRGTRADKISPPAIVQSLLDHRTMVDSEMTSVVAQLRI